MPGNTISRIGNSNRPQNLKYAVGKRVAIGIGAGRHNIVIICLYYLNAALVTGGRGRCYGPRVAIGPGIIIVDDVRPVNTGISGIIYIYIIYSTCCSPVDVARPPHGPLITIVRIGYHNLRPYLEIVRRVIRDLSIAGACG